MATTLLRLLSFLLSVKGIHAAEKNEFQYAKFSSRFMCKIRGAYAIEM
jgi:hypothetical protein